MARAYLRLDPAFFDRKVIDQKYPPGAVAALIGVLCHAEHQPKRGRFRDVRVLKALLGPLQKWIPFLIEHRDIVSKKGELYVDGWDEWQEGDWKVGERVKRIRNRQKADAEPADVTVGVTPDVTVDVTVGTESDESVGTVYTPSDGGRQSVIDGGGAGGGGKQTPQPPASGGRRANGTSPRAVAQAEQARRDEADRAKRWRRSQRQQAYLRGTIDETQRAEMDRRDAPLEEIPDWTAHLASLRAAMDDDGPLAAASADVTSWTGKP